MIHFLKAIRLTMSNLTQFKGELWLFNFEVVFQ